MRSPFTVVCMLTLMQVPAEQTAPTQRASGPITEGVNAVLVDVVVRDKKGQPVRDLTAADFEIIEDGKPQQIGSFTPIFAKVAGSSAPVPSPIPLATEGMVTTSSAPVNAGPIVTALVFDRLSPESRRLAVSAAQSYLSGKNETESYVGIFGIDLSLTSYAPITRDARVLRRALDRMATRGSSSFESPEERRQKADADRNAASAASAASQATASAGGAAGGSGVGTAPGDAELAQMQASMIREFDVMERDQQGYATTNGLFAIISTLRRLPGRKSLVLFSEGIAIPPAVQRLFAGVIDAANRANVSIYTMDAAGLRAESQQAEVGKQVNDAGARGINTGYATSGGKTNVPLTKALENNEYVLRQDPHTGLAQLAEQTGGLLFDNTNNLRQGFDRIESDLHNYYLLGYTPSNEKYDGRFRAIEVKVSRPGVVIAARKGYFAVRNAGALPINSWEASALACLEEKPLPNAFAVRSGAMLFPEHDRPGLVAVVVDLETTPLTFHAGADGKTYSSDFTVLVRFLDVRNQVVRQVSQHYEVQGPLSAVDRAKHGEVIFYRQAELDPGVYTMETVVHDAPSGKSSVRIATVEVPREDISALRMSSLLLVKRGEKIDGKDQRADNPLLVNDAVLYPNLGETVSKKGKEVGFYFVVYPSDAASIPEAALQLLQDGKLLAELPMSLNGTANDRRIQQVGRLPLDRIAPGTYELRAVVKRGQQQLFRSAMLRVTE